MFGRNRLALLTEPAGLANALGRVT
jgi:hypothetical protein